MERLLAFVDGGGADDLVYLRATPDGKLLVTNATADAAIETNWATTYAYSASGQITSETRTSGALTQTRPYGYDGSGNLVSIGAWA